MAKSMTKTQVTMALAEKTGLTKQQVTQFFQELAGMAYDQSEHGFPIPGIGKLVLVDRKGRKGRNPRTGEEIWIPPKRALKFRLSKEAKVAVDALHNSKPAEESASPSTD